MRILNCFRRKITVAKLRRRRTVDKLKLGIFAQQLRRETALADAAVYKSIWQGSKLRPSRFVNVDLQNDGVRWVCWYGDQSDGVVGYGSSPEGAMVAFDQLWLKSQ